MNLQDTQIGTVTYIKLRIYDVFNASVPAGSIHPIMRRPTGEIYFALSGMQIEPAEAKFVHPLDMESWFIVSHTPDVILDIPVQFHSRYWDMEEFTKFIESDLCSDGPNKRMEIRLEVEL